MNFIQVKRAVIWLVVFVLHGCVSLPDNSNKEESYALPVNPETYLAQRLDRLPLEDDLSGFYPLRDGLDAFVARLAAIDAAEQGIDIQYYLFHNDMIGRLMMHRLLQAADRGVRVRFLLDDMAALGNDEMLAVFHSHPNVSVRVFNPFSIRSSLHVIQYLTDFYRVTRRMHNKLLCVDGELVLLGGRNIGNEYYEADQVNFNDLDVIASGPVVREAEQSFDSYWNSDHAYPIDQLANLRDVPEARLDEARKLLDQSFLSSAAEEFRKRLQSSELLQAIQRDQIGWFFGRAMFYGDPPEKVDSFDQASSMLEPLLQNIEQAQHEVLLISPYFVPGRRGVKYLTSLVERGVDVAVLTNSLASTDVALVHSGYSRYRRKLIKAGVELYESKPSKIVENKNYELLGSGKVSLHTKAYIVDRRWVFIGSPNLDPRSNNINTEIGILFDSPPFAEHLYDRIETSEAGNVWKVELEDRSLVWRDTGDSGEVLEKEPHTSLMWRFFIRLMSVLPIESQL